MLLISVIKFLIVMPNARNLAQAAQGAAAPKNVNVVEKTASVNQPVQPIVDTDNQSSTQVETIDDVVKRICTDGHSYVMTTVITNIDCQERTGRNGKSYLNAFVTIAIIEVENDNSITSVEVTNLHPTNNDIPLV
jgi:hypothetical protein